MDADDSMRGQQDRQMHMAPEISDLSLSEDPPSSTWERSYKRRRRDAI
jgi:hypothetical protein